MIEKFIGRIRRVRVDAPLLVYSLVACLILAPLLRPGFILTLDMVFTPQLRMPAEVSSSWLFHAMLHVLDNILPADLIQKVLLFAILVLAGLGVHRLVEYLKLGKGVAVYYAGLLYIVNPYSYERFMAGQYAVLFGYALLPWFMRSVLKLAEKPSWRPALAVAGWALVISIVSIHTVLPAAVVALSVFAWRLARLRDKRADQVRLMKFVAGMAGVCVVASSYWLVPLISGSNQQAEFISSFSAQDRQAFATGGGTAIEQILNMLRLQGFWPERYGLFILPQDVLPLWLWSLALLVVLALAAIGGFVLWRRGNRGLLAVLAAMLVFGVVLGAGIGSEWLARLPFLAGYREPHKLAMLVALAYVVLGSVGLSTLLRRAEQRKQEVLSGVLPPLALALPFVLVPCFLWAGKGQLQAADYPTSWYAVNDQLNKSGDNARSLFLPWHLYMHTSFAGRIIANPAPKFFDTPMVVSGDPEFGGAAYAQPTVATRRIEAALKDTKANSKSFTATLSSLGIQYVVLSKESDYQKYDFLDRQPGLQKVADYREMSLYRNQEYKQ